MKGDFIMKKLFLTLGAVALLAACVQINNQASSSSSSSAVPSSVESGTNQERANHSNVQTVRTNLGDQQLILKDLIQAIQSTVSNAAFKSIELEQATQPLMYKVTVTDGTKETEYVYNADTKAVTAVEMDATTQAELNYEKFDVATLKNVDDMITIAVNGDKNIQVTKWSVDKENGRIVWKVDTLQQGQEVEITVDNETERIVKTDKD